MGESKSLTEEQFTIRPYRPADQPAVLAMWAEVFGKQLPEPLWRWKYVENPFGYRILLSVKDTGEILAFFGGIPYSANWDGRTTEIIQLMDIMSHPRYRGAGFFIRTVLAFIESYTGIDKAPLLYGFPGKQHFEIGEKYLQYSRLKDGAAYLVAGTGDGIGALSGSLFCVEPVSRVDESFDRLWEACRGDYPMSVIRDGRFLQWRFLDHPLNQYEIWRCWNSSKERLAGYAVTSVKDGDVVIVDWLSAPEQQTVAGFLSRLKASYHERGIKRIVTWLPSGHRLSGMFRGAGFNAEPEPIGFIPTARSFAEELSIAWVMDHIYYTMADGDLF